MECLHRFCSVCVSHKYNHIFKNLFSPALALVRPCAMRSCVRALMECVSRILHVLIYSNLTPLLPPLPLPLLFLHILSSPPPPPLNIKLETKKSIACKMCIEYAIHQLSIFIRVLSCARALVRRGLGWKYVHCVFHFHLSFPSSSRASARRTQGTRFKIRALRLTHLRFTHKMWGLRTRLNNFPCISCSPACACAY